MRSHYQPDVNVFLLGLQGSGKSTFCSQIEPDEPDEQVEIISPLTGESFIFFRQKIPLANKKNLNATFFEIPASQEHFQHYIKLAGLYRESCFSVEVPPSIVLWFIDASSEACRQESIDYINKHAAYVNPTALPSHHFLVVTKTDLNDNLNMKKISHQVNAQLNIQGVFHCSGTNGSGTESVIDCIKNLTEDYIKRFDWNQCLATLLQKPFSDLSDLENKVLGLKLPANNTTFSMNYYTGMSVGNDNPDFSDNKNFLDKIAFSKKRTKALKKITDYNINFEKLKAPSKFDTYFSKTIIKTLEAHIRVELSKSKCLKDPPLSKSLNELDREVKDIFDHPIFKIIDDELSKINALKKFLLSSEDLVQSYQKIKLIFPNKPDDFKLMDQLNLYSDGLSKHFKFLEESVENCFVSNCRLQMLLDYFDSLNKQFKSLEFKSFEKKLPSCVIPLKLKSSGEIKNLMILGPKNSGKTALLNGKAWNIFETGHSTHYFSSFPIMLSQGKRPDAVWCDDFNSDEVEGNMMNIHMLSHTIFLFCVDVSSDETINNAINYLIKFRCHPQFKQKTNLPEGDAKFYLVFTKKDLKKVHTLSEYKRIKNQILAGIKSISLIKKVMGPGVKVNSLPKIVFEPRPFICSAKNNEAIDELFSTLQRKHFPNAPSWASRAPLETIHLGEQMRITGYCDPPKSEKNRAYFPFISEWFSDTSNNPESKLQDNRTAL